MHGNGDQHGKPMGKPTSARMPGVVSGPPKTNDALTCPTSKMPQRLGGTVQTNPRRPATGSRMPKRIG